MNAPKKAVVIGASTGIGRALAKTLAAAGYEVGLASRQIDLIRELQKEIPQKTYARQLDLQEPEKAMQITEDLIREMGGMDLMVINSGVNHYTRDFEWSKDFHTVSVNVTGFMAMANVAARHFIPKKAGHIVGISSIAGVRGSGRAPVYCATKAFVTNYLEGLRHEVGRYGIAVTDIKPGFVDTAMLAQRGFRLGMVSTESAAADILRVIQARRSAAFVPGWWALVAFILRLMPDALYCRLIRRARDW